MDDLHPIFDPPSYGRIGAVISPHGRQGGVLGLFGPCGRSTREIGRPVPEDDSLRGSPLLKNQPWSVTSS